jgi:sugar O-acyltransferase (sialic acid O-acetyltransferase NeuD family)
MPSEIVLFGVESVFTPELVETARRCGHSIAAYVLASEPEWDMLGLQAVGISELTAEMLTVPYVLPWVTPGLRQAKCLAAEAVGFTSILTLIDPAAVVASNAQVDPGVYLNAGVTIGAYAHLGSYCLVNRNASVGHHSTCDSFVSMGPGVTVCARCKIGKGTMIGAGAVLAPGVTIGQNCLIALGACVTRDVPDNCKASGNPARITRTGIRGYREFEVR